VFDVGSHATGVAADRFSSSGEVFIRRPAETACKRVNGGELREVHAHFNIARILINIFGEAFQSWLILTYSSYLYQSWPVLCQSYKLSIG